MGLIAGMRGRRTKDATSPGGHMQTNSDTWTYDFETPRDAASRLDDLAARSGPADAAKYRRWAGELLVEAERQEAADWADLLVPVAATGM